MEKAKAIVTVMLFVILLLGAIIVPTIIISDKNYRKEYFPESKDVDLTEKTINNNEANIKTRKELETDPYFVKFATAHDYNYTHIKRETDPTTGLKVSTLEDGYLEKMIINFIYNFQLSNTKNVTSIDYSAGKFCLEPYKVKEAMEELYFTEVGLNGFMDYLPGYTDYVSRGRGTYCFDFDKVSKSHESDVILGIDNISISDKKIITSNVYVYNYYITGTQSENSLVNRAKQYINSNNYLEAKKIVENNLGGVVKHRKIVFRVNSRKKYFEYQLLYASDIK